MESPATNHHSTIRNQDVVKPQRLSFKQTLMPSNLDDSAHMQVQHKGEFLSIKVDESLVQQNISQLQNSLIGKLTLSQGDSPYSVENFKKNARADVGVGI